jgi:hypothetical protein
MTVLLPFSWLALLYASEALGLAFVVYTIKNSPGVCVVHFDCTSPKYSHPLQARFRNYYLLFLLCQSCQDSHGVLWPGHHCKTPTDWRACVCLWSPTLLLIPGRRGCASACLLWLPGSRAPPADPVCADSCLYIVHPALSYYAVSMYAAQPELRPLARRPMYAGVVVVVAACSHLSLALHVVAVVKLAPARVVEMLSLFTWMLL